MCWLSGLGDAAASFPAGGGAVRGAWYASRTAAAAPPRAAIGGAARAFGPAGVEGAPNAAMRLADLHPRRSRLARGARRAATDSA
ncbi:hypothetical protein GCM10023324_39800 [Streptomyces youssoufiensis]